jgi:hypothetical protein
MFGFEGGEDAGTVARKRDHMRDAQGRWRFLTFYDASTIKNARQLADMVRTRTSVSEEQAKTEVETWMRGKQF